MQKKPSLLQIFSLCKKEIKLPIEKLNLICSKVYKNHKIAHSRITNLIFCGNKKIKTLNKIYRKKDKPTDVLSFPFNDPDLLGEIYISLDKAKKQAKEYNTSLEEEIIRLFVHGLLHLVGFDHKTKKEAEEMKINENLYFQYLKKKK